MKRFLTILAWMVLGSVLTLAGLFASGASVVWRYETNPAPQTQLDERPYLAALPSSGRHRPSGTRSSSIYVLSAGPVDPVEIASAQRAFDAGAPMPDFATHALGGHRVTDSEGAVILLRWGWGANEPGQIPEAAGFEKLTVFLPAGFEGRSGVLDLADHPGAFIFWSKGPANPPWGDSCVAFTTEGRIEYRSKKYGINNDGFDIDLEISLSPVKASSGSPEDCEPIHFNDRISLWIGKVEYLRAWDGGGWGRVTIHEAVPSHLY